MSNTLHKIIDGVRIELTAEEIAAHDAAVAAFVPEKQSAPTKEQLMAELAVLTAKIQEIT